MKRTCVQCGKTFILSDSEIKFYKNRNLSIPKRCKECREENKKNKGNRVSSDSKPSDGVSHDTPGTGSTAAGESSIKADDKTAQESKGKTVETGKRKGRYSFAGAAAALVLLAAGGGIYTHNNLNSTNPSMQPQTAYEYMAEADEESDSSESIQTEETQGDTVQADAGTEDAQDNTVQTAVRPEYTFRNKEYLEEHYEKHGREMGFASAEEYEAAASAVVNDPRALHKLEAEDGDDVYYIEETNEFVIVSGRGYLRTYFKPNAGKRYYDKQ